jgi:hypothetical protein
MDGDASVPRGAAANGTEGATSLGRSGAAMADATAAAMLETQRRMADAMSGIGGLALAWMRAAGEQQMATAQRIGDELTRTMRDLAGPGSPQAKAERLLALTRMTGELGLESADALNGLALRFGTDALTLGAPAFASAVKARPGGA